MDMTLHSFHRDRLYVLNSEDFKVEASLNWASINTTMCVSENPDKEDYMYICRNHIRVHTPIPTDSRKLFVCGTQAIETPRCRIVEVKDNGSTLDASTDVDVSNGIVSYYPGFPQFGEFRRGRILHETYVLLKITFHCLSSSCFLPSLSPSFPFLSPPFPLFFFSSPSLPHSSLLSTSLSPPLPALLSLQKVHQIRPTLLLVSLKAVVDLADTSVSHTSQLLLLLTFSKFLSQLQRDSAQLRTTITGSDV